MKYLLPIGLSLVVFFTACTHEPNEGPILPKPGLPVYREAIPVSELQEPGCEPQMPIDSMWHKAGSIDSNYIRDLMVNPSNPKEWVYVQHIVRPRETWNILWYVDLKQGKKRKLDSSYWAGFGSLSWGGGYITYQLRSESFLFELDTELQVRLEATRNTSLSPDGKYMVYDEAGSTFVRKRIDNDVIREWHRGVARAFWSRNGKQFYTHTTNLENGNRELKKVEVNDWTPKVIYSTEEVIGPGIECIAHNENEFYLSNHDVVNLETETHGEFFPYCKRQYLEKIIPLRDTREYLTIKTYRETVDSYTTHIFHHFHVFDENWENERRVTLNFDF